MDDIQKALDIAENDIINKEILEQANAIETIKVACNELLQYRKIGTLEECRAARERQIPNGPIYEGDGYADGVMVYDIAFCPLCDHMFEEGYEGWKTNFCPKCGQALDWPDIEAEPLEDIDGEN